MNGLVITYPAGYSVTNDYVSLIGASTRNAKRSLVRILVVQLGIITFFDLEEHLVFHVSVSFDKSCKMRYIERITGQQKGCFLSIESNHNYLSNVYHFQSNRFCTDMRMTPVYCGTSLKHDTYLLLLYIRHNLFHRATNNFMRRNNYQVAKYKVNEGQLRPCSL